MFWPKIMILLLLLLPIPAMLKKLFRQKRGCQFWRGYGTISGRQGISKHCFFNFVQVYYGKTHSSPATRSRMAKRPNAAADRRASRTPTRSRRSVVSEVTRPRACAASLPRAGALQASAIACARRTRCRAARAASAPRCRASP